MSLTIITSVAIHASTKEWQAEADKRKADYIFMQAISQQAQEDYGSYYYLLEDALKLDPDNAAAGSDLGYLLIVTAKGDTTRLANGYQLMRRQFEVEPTDIYSSMAYGTIAQKLGRTKDALEVWQTLHRIYPEKSEIALMYVDALGHADTTGRELAISLLDTLIIREGYSLPLISRRTALLLEQRDTTAIVDGLKQFTASTPRSAESRVYAANIYEALGLKEEALSLYNEACDVDPTSGVAFYSRGMFYLNQNDTVAYDREVQHAMMLPDLELETKLEILTEYLRKLYMDSTSRPAIEQMFTRLVDDYPHEAEVNQLYASYFFAIKDYTNAAREIQSVVDADPSNEEAWRSLISTWLMVSNYNEAFKASTEAVHRFPDTPVFMVLAIESAIIGNNYSDAKKLITESMKNIENYDYSTQSRLYQLAGDLEYKNGEHDIAFSYYDKAIEIDPENDIALNNAAYYLACDGQDLDRAQNLSEKSLLLRPDNPNSLDTYAWIMFKKADYKKALELIDKVIELLSDEDEEISDEALEHAGDIYFMSGNPAKALEFWQQALEKRPDNALLKKKVTHKTYFYE